MGKINSRRKGAAGEREGARKWQSLFVCEARRGQQFSGLEGKDIVQSIPGIHLESKRVNRSSILKWHAQAKQDAEDGETPIVLWRPDRSPWFAIVELDDLPRLVRKLQEFLEPDWLD